MRLMRGTRAQCEAVADIVDKEMGLPRREAFIGDPGYPYVIQETWDGTGPTPPCWTHEHEAVYAVSDADAYYRLEDSVANRIAASGRVTGGEKAQVAAVLASRVDSFDYSDRGTKRRRPVVARARAIEEKD